MTNLEIACHPLTPERWPDLERLFRAGGDAKACWCMWWRQTGAEYSVNRGAGNRDALYGIVAGGEVPGILAYVGGEPAGWISVAPREQFPRVKRSRRVRPVADDGNQTWAIVCFVIAKEHRGQGLMRRLIGAACEYAAAHAAAAIEAYPKDPSAGPVSSDSAFTGIEPVFREFGFEEVVRRVPVQPVMRNGSYPE